MHGPEPSPLGKRELLVAAALYLALALAWLWPLPLHLATHAAYTPVDHKHGLEGADWYLIVWALAWGAHALVTQPFHVFDANAFHPAPASLAFSEHFLGLQPLFAPTYLATGNAVLATNLLLIAVFASSALAFYAFARRFVGGPAALVGGMLFSFTPWRHHALFHFHLLGVQYLPLALLMTERWLERAQRRDAWLLATALLLQALSSVYLAFALTVLYAPYLALALWRWRARLDRRRLAGLALVLVAVGLGMGMASVPYLRLAGLGLIPVYGTGEYGTAIGVAFSRPVVHRYLATGGVGPCGYALALVGLLPPWRRRRWPLAIGVVTFVVGVLIACGGKGPLLGSWQLPAVFPWLTWLFPPVAAIRLPARVVVVAHLGVCLLAALGLHRLVVPWRAGAAWAASLAVTGGLLGSFQSPPALHAVPACASAPEPAAWLARHGDGRPVLEWPPPATSAEAARRMYLSACHWLPVVGGYSAYPPRVAALIYDAGHGLPNADALERVVDTIDLGWIVVDRGALGPADRARWDQPLPPGLAEAARLGNVRVLRVTRAPGPGDRRARLFSTTETLGGVPLAPLGARCAGRLALTGPLPAFRRATTAPLPLIVTNLGDRAWPGFGVIPRHLVHTRACVAPIGASCTTAPVPLGVDVPAGATRVVTTAVTVPPLALGRAELRVELWQLGDGPLEACGTAPLRVPTSVRGG